MTGDEVGGVEDAAAGPFTDRPPPPPPPANPPPPPPPPPPGAWSAAPANTYLPGAPPVAPPTGLGSLSTATQVLLAVMGTLSLASLALNLTYAGQVDGFAVGDATLGEVERLEDQLAGLAGLSILGLLVTAVVYLVWQARVRQAAEALGAHGFRHTRGMAIGGWFIPFANLVIPKKAVDDLWRGTEPRQPGSFDITGHPVAGIVTGWWVLWLVSNVVDADFGSRDTLSEISSAARRAAFGDVLAIAAAVLAVLVVRRLTTRARERATTLGVPLS